MQILSYVRHYDADDFAHFLKRVSESDCGPWMDWFNKEFCSHCAGITLEGKTADERTTQWAPCELIKNRDDPRLYCHGKCFDDEETTIVDWLISELDEDWLNG